jgi:hypothetical protein
MAREKLRHNSRNVNRLRARRVASRDSGAEDEWESRVEGRRKMQRAGIFRFSLRRVAQRPDKPALRYPRAVITPRRGPTLRPIAASKSLGLELDLRLRWL